ncbi:hypothetical protein GCM10027299_38920 [Larkinella ripae]
MQTRFGLQEKDLQAILEVLGRQPEIEKAYLFGSRANGNFRNGSDVDLALKGRLLDLGIINRINYLLNEESILPYRFDLLNYHTLTNQALIDHIDRVGVEIYRNLNPFDRDLKS